MAVYNGHPLNTTSSSLYPYTIACDPASLGNYTATVTLNNGTSWDSNYTHLTHLAEFCELVFAALGHDVTFAEFQNMSDDQRKSLLRDIKLNRVLYK